MVSTRGRKYGNDKCRYLSICPRELFIFGSYAKGSNEPNDLDFILLYDKLNKDETDYYWRSDMRGNDPKYVAISKIFKNVPKPYDLISYELQGENLDLYMTNDYDKIFWIMPAEIDFKKITPISASEEIPIEVLPIIERKVYITEYTQLWMNDYD